MVAFINMTIIKQNNMTYQHKIIFCIRYGFGYGFRVGIYIPITRVLKSGKTQTQSKRRKPVKLGLVRAGNHEYEFYCHALFMNSNLILVNVSCTIL